MTKRRDLERHRDSLAEIGEILSSMKTLAYMETRKLARFSSSQQRVVESIQDVAADFLHFFPASRPETDAATPVFLVVGSERGFCGDFNRTLITRLDEARAAYEHARPRVLVVGHKLHALLEDDESVVAFLDGASVAEEVPAVLQRLIDELSAQQGNIAGLVLIGIHHDRDDVAVTALLPPFERRSPDFPGRAIAPLLNVPAEAFLRELVEHYLFAALNHMLYASLMAENQRRVSHLEGAVRHLDEKSGELARKCKALRQEEIVEEIEVILLSATGLAGGDG